MLPLLAALTFASAASATAVKHARVPDLPVMTPAPDLKYARALAARQDSSSITLPDSLMGYYTVGGTQAMNCGAGQTWTSVGTWARCCTSGDICAMATACTRTSLIADNGGGTLTCGQPCGTMTVYAEYPDVSPVKNIACFGTAWQAFTIYRQFPASSTSSSSSSSSSASSTGTGTSATGTTGTASSSGASSSASETGTAENSSSGSKAWIAGAVVGPIVGIALLFGIGFYIGRRRRSKNTPAPPGANNFVMHEDRTEYYPHYAQGGAPGAPMNQPGGLYPPQQGQYVQMSDVNAWKQPTGNSPMSAGGYSEADSRPVEAQRPAELPGSTYK